MSEDYGPAPAYTCPMHREVRAAAAGKCPECGLPLVRRDARFSILRQIFGDPLNVAVMLAFLFAAAAVAMIIR